MANNSQIANAQTTYTTVKGIKLLHKRYTTADWASHSLSQGEFGIAIDTGEVRGYIHYSTGSAETCSWDQATPVGSTVLSTEGGTAADRTYVYGVTEDKVNGHSRGWKLLTSTIPEITVTDSTLNTDTADLADANANSTEYARVVTHIEKDGTDGITFTEGKIPAPKFNVSGNGYVTDITKVDGKFNEYNVTRTEAPTLDGTQVDYKTNDGTIVGGIAFDGHTITATAKKIVSADGSKIQVGYDANGNITIGIDDSDYAKADITGSMTFKGTIDISDSAQLQLNNADKYTWEEGFAYKVIQTTTSAGQVTSSGMKIHLSDGTQVTTATVKPGDLLVCVQSSDSTLGKHICLIPSGDETDGTVTQVTVGTGLIVEGGDSNNTITSTGTIKHVVAQNNSTDNTKVGVVPTAGSQYDNANLNIQTSDTEEYELINYVEVDKDNLGHVTDVRKTKIKILSEESIENISKRNGSTVTEGARINVTTVPATTDAQGNVTPASYKVAHGSVSAADGTVTKGATAQESRKYIKSVTTDDFGHVTSVDMGEETLSDTWRPVQVNGTAIPQDKTLNLVGDNHISITNTADGSVTIRDNITTASTDVQGLTKVHEVASSAITVDTEASKTAVDSRYYGTTIDNQGKVSVHIPDHVVNNTGVADAGLNFCAIQRDKYGHIIAISTIDVIDGNDA